MEYQTILYTMIVLIGLGLLAAVILYLVAQRFKVYEDPRIDAVEAVLPGINCGGCGYPGCRGFAEAMVGANDLSAMFCPPGGNETLAAVVRVLGKEAVWKEPQVAVVRCAGSPEHRPYTLLYDGAPSCRSATMLYSGDTGCAFGCLGLGDCARVCTFDALRIDPSTRLPQVNQQKCTACNACVKACPKLIIELRRRGPKDKRIFVSCVNREKGGVAKRSCAVACIGCTKCAKVCPHSAIAIESYLAYIDPVKCKLCRKCVEVCPTSAIVEANFPARKRQEALEGAEGG